MKMLISCLLLFFFITSINAQNKLPKELSGSWVLDLPGEGEIPSQKMVWKFYSSEDTKDIAEFHWLFKRLEDKEFITVAVIKGYLIVNGDLFASETFMAGTQQKEMYAMEFSEEIMWYKSGDPKYEKFPKKESHHFEIEGNKLKIKDDHNKDGDFNDKDETTVLTKMK